MEQGFIDIEQTKSYWSTAKHTQIKSDRAEEEGKDGHILSMSITAEEDVYVQQASYH